MKQKILCIAGPTGTGKSAVALHIAERLSGGIINCDSRQVYADFPLITAQPSSKDLQRCPHLLYGFLSTAERISAGQWSELVKPCFSRFSLPVLVGGTGLYLRALFDGIVDIPPLDEQIQKNLLAAYLLGEPLHTLLAEIDPLYASKIHPHDRQRVVRALAVYQTTGKTFSWWHDQTPAPSTKYDILRIGFKLPLDALEPRLIARIDTMLASGALEEAKAAYAACPDASAPGWSGIGCRELLAYMQGTISLDECRAVWGKNTRAYAKRQLTWFNADNRIRWFSPGDSQQAVQVVEDWFQGKAV